MHWTFLNMFILIGFTLTYSDAIDDERVILSEGAKRSIMLSILDDIGILHDSVLQSVPVIGRKIHEAAMDLAIQRSILSNNDQDDNSHDKDNSYAPRFERLMQKDANKPSIPLPSQTNFIYQKEERIKMPSFLKGRSKPLAVGGPSVIAPLSETVWSTLHDRFFGNNHLSNSPSDLSSTDPLPLIQSANDKTKQLESDHNEIEEPPGDGSKADTVVKILSEVRELEGLLTVFEANKDKIINAQENLSKNDASVTTSNTNEQKTFSENIRTLSNLLQTLDQTRLPTQKQLITSVSNPITSNSENNYITPKSNNSPMKKLSSTSPPTIAVSNSDQSSTNLTQLRATLVAPRIPEPKVSTILHNEDPSNSDDNTEPTTNNAATGAVQSNSIPQSTNALAKRIASISLPTIAISKSDQSSTKLNQLRATLVATQKVEPTLSAIRHNEDPSVSEDNDEPTINNLATEAVQPHFIPQSTNALMQRITSISSPTIANSKSDRSSANPFWATVSTIPHDETPSNSEDNTGPTTNSPMTEPVPMQPHFIPQNTNTLVKRITSISSPTIAISKSNQSSANVNPFWATMTATRRPEPALAGIVHNEDPFKSNDNTEGTTNKKMVHNDVQPLWIPQSTNVPLMGINSANPPTISFPENTESNVNYRWSNMMAHGQPDRTVPVILNNRSSFNSQSNTELTKSPVKQMISTISPPITRPKFVESPANFSRLLDTAIAPTQPDPMISSVPDPITVVPATDNLQHYSGTFNMKDYNIRANTVNNLPFAQQSYNPVNSGHATYTTAFHLGVDNHKLFEDIAAKLKENIETNININRAMSRIPPRSAMMRDLKQKLGMTTVFHRVENGSSLENGPNYKKPSAIVNSSGSINQNQQVSYLSTSNTRQGHLQKPPGSSVPIYQAEYPKGIPRVINTNQHVPSVYSYPIPQQQGYPQHPPTTSMPTHPSSSLQNLTPAYNPKQTNRYPLQISPMHVNYPSATNAPRYYWDASSRTYRPVHHSYWTQVAHRSSSTHSGHNARVNQNYQNQRSTYPLSNGFRLPSNQQYITTNSDTSGGESSDDDEDDDDDDDDDV